MEDNRIDILCKEFDPVSEDCRTMRGDLQLAITLNPSIDKIINAMDENGKQMCLDLLEYIAKNLVSATMYNDHTPIFLFKGQWITKEQLFENFL